MNIRTLLFFFLLLPLSCKKSTESASASSSTAEVKVAGAMRNVMWKGELGPSILLDTISDQQGLYGLGPAAYLRGELLIKNGKSYISKVLTDSTMQVRTDTGSEAPFFVYTNVKNWQKVALPDSIRNIKTLEIFIDRQTQDAKRPFAFKLTGTVEMADIHIQNLPEGTKVSSPEEAHQGQTNYILNQEEVEIIGFFSTVHQGVFTHHDTFLHMHLITKDEQKMGHLDQVHFTAKEMQLFLPTR